jgi:hypothetical protein
MIAFEFPKVKGFRHSPATRRRVVILTLPSVGWQPWKTSGFYYPTRKWKHSPIKS